VGGHPEVAVVTGASRGIGRAIAVSLAGRGLTVALLSKPSDRLGRVADEVRALGARAEVLPCDVGEEAQVLQAAEAVLDRLGTPAVVINNAAIIRRGHSVRDMPTEDWDDVLRVNLRGAFLVARAFLGPMLEARRGRIVSVSSISATLGCPGIASYAASKWGLVGLAKSLAEELRGTGVQSMCVLPGSVDTDMLVGSGFTPNMTAEHVANTVLYAALDAPAAMNGSAIEIFG